MSQVRLAGTDSPYLEVHGENSAALSRDAVTQVRAKRLELDPDNALLSRMPLRRLDAEALWDSLVFVAGRLDETRFGPPVPVQARPDGVVTPGRSGNGWRRSIYGQQLRKDLPTVLEVFDAPAMNPNCLERSESIVSPQALHLLNDPVVRELASGFAERVRKEAGPDPARQVERAFRIAFARLPTPRENKESVDMLRNLSAAWEEFRHHRSSTAVSLNSQEPSEVVSALTTLCHALINSAEFLHID